MPASVQYGFFSFFIHSLSAVSGVFIVAAKRTAFGTYGGKLKDVSANVLQLAAAKAALEASKVNPELVGSVVFGNVIQVLPSIILTYLPKTPYLR